jgi:dTMP kinase
VPEAPGARPRGRLLALEGIDGSGKSTQARALADALGAQLTHEPGATPVGARLRELLLAPDAPPLSVRTEALLMAADRAEHVAQVIQPALAAGAWVVTDRFSASTIAYQGYGRGLEPDALHALVSWAADGLAGGGRRGADRLERLGPAFASAVRDGFLAQAEAEPDRWLVVDGTEEEAALTAHIVAEVQARFGVPPAARR